MTAARRSKPTLRSIAPAARASEAAVELLESLLERAKAGEIVGVTVVSETREAWCVDWSRAEDKMRRIGILTMALHAEVRP